MHEEQPTDYIPWPRFVPKRSGRSDLDVIIIGPAVARLGQRMGYGSRELVDPTLLLGDA